MDIFLKVIKILLCFWNYWAGDCYIEEYGEI